MILLCRIQSEQVYQRIDYIKWMPPPPLKGKTFKGLEWKKTPHFKGLLGERNVKVNNCFEGRVAKKDTQP